MKGANFLDGTEKELRIKQVIDIMHDAYTLILTEDFTGAAGHLEVAAVIARTIDKDHSAEA